MIKPIYGLKDAARAWRKKLHQVLCCWSMSQLRAEGELYVRHSYPQKLQPESGIRRLQKMVDKEEASAIRYDKSLSGMALRAGGIRPRLVLLLSTHVDDLKGWVTRKNGESLLNHLCQASGPCKA